MATLSTKNDQAELPYDFLRLVFPEVVANCLILFTGRGHGRLSLRRVNRGDRRIALLLEMISIRHCFLLQKIMSRPELIAPPEIVGWVHNLLMHTNDVVDIG